MQRTNPSIRRSLVAAALAVAGAAASGAVLADDSSMSMWTGDSYAYFNGLDYRLGKFNTARATQAHDEAPVATMPRKDKAEKPVMLATRPRETTRTNPFRDDTGA